NGIILPMAAHKGYGVAVMMDVLTGVLTGSAFGSGVVGPYEPEKRSGAGQMMLALNIEAFMPAAQFQSRMEALIAELKNTPMADGAKGIFYPGELEALSEETGRRE